MEFSSYKELVDSRSIFEKFLVELGLEMKSDSWLYSAYDLIEEITDLFKDESRLDEFKKNKSKNGEASLALYDLAILNEILPCTTNENEDILKIKFKKILNITSLLHENINNNDARNTLLELKLFSHLKRKGIQVNLGEPNPDILMNWNSLCYRIECKRIFSMNKKFLGRSLRHNIKRAVKQLKDPLQVDDNARGVIVLSLERPIMGDNPLFIAESEKDGKEKLKSELIKIANDYGIFWDSSRIQNDKIIAVMLYLGVPGIVKQEHMFGPANQILVTNVWKDDQSRKLFEENFNPLKDILEY